MTSAPRRRHTSAEVHDAAALLGVALPASQAEVRSAWRQALRVTHPDHADPAARRSAEHLASQLNEARDVLLAAGDMPGAPPALRRSLTDILEQQPRASVQMPSAPPHPAHPTPGGPPHAWPPAAHPVNHPGRFVPPSGPRPASRVPAPAASSERAIRVRAAVALALLLVLVAVAVAVAVSDLLDGIPLP